MSVGRIQLIEKDAAPPRLHAIYERADGAFREGQLPGAMLFGNQVRALAHHPALLEALVGVYAAFAASPTVERRLIELGVLISSRVNACEYCSRHHTPLARAAGLSLDQLRCIENGDWQGMRQLWTEREWLVIRYAQQLTEAPYKIKDSFFAELRRQFDDRQIVDMSMRFALCSAWNKFNDALNLDTETAFQQAYADILSGYSTKA